MAASVFDRFPPPPSATLLGWQLIEADPKAGRIRVGFEGKPEFCNPAGFIQGGILAAMLDDTMGPAVLVATDGALYTITIDLHVSYLQPAKIGRLIGDATAVQIGKTIAFIDGKLSDANGMVIAKASATARLVPTSKAIA